MSFTQFHACARDVLSCCRSLVRSGLLRPIPRSTAKSTHRAARGNSTPMHANNGIPARPPSAKPQKLAPRKWWPYLQPSMEAGRFSPATCICAELRCPTACSVGGLYPALPIVSLGHARDPEHGRSRLRCCARVRKAGPVVVIGICWHGLPESLRSHLRYVDPSDGDRQNPPDPEVPCNLTTMHGEVLSFSRP